MTRRFIDPGICMLTALALLVAVIVSPGRQVLGHSHVGPIKRPRNGAASKIGHVASESSRHFSDLVASDPFTHKDEMSEDFEDELSLVSMPAFPFIAILPSPRSNPMRLVASFAVTGPSRPLRC